MTEQPDKSYSRLAWELAKRASFSMVDSRRGENVQAGLRLETSGAIVHGYGTTSSAAMRDLARSLDRALADPRIWPQHSHGVLIGVEGPNVVLHAHDFHAVERPALIIFDEAMDVAEVLEEAIGDATRNACS